MKRKRRHLTAEFKARVAAEALEGEKTIQQIAQENDIAPTQVSTWKKDLEDHMPSIFERKNAAEQSAEKQERRTSHLERKIGNSSSRKSSSKNMRSAGNRSERKAIIDPSDKKLSIRKQSKLLGINRNRLATRQTQTTEEDRKIMTIMDKINMECPFYGQRNLRENLKDHGHSIERKRVRRLMRIMGIEALVPKPSTSVSAKGHEIFHYLLRNQVIDTVDDV